ncbi:MAG: BTAD domain-containing putative transcriptional regulator [Pseudonocardia sp.]
MLGEVEVLLDGRPVDIGHARQRAVLAALLVDVNRVVPVDRLIDRVWADRPPYRARNALSAYVSRLRQRLAGATGVRISRGPGGYALAADPLAVDLHAFRHLVDRARTTDGPAGAADCYAQALRLWRGTAVATAEGPWFDDLRTSLHAELLAATLDRYDAALAAGRHADVLTELADTTRTYPLDERLAGQLMLAQYRSGRQTEAFATYERMRERLRDELGADPGSGLRDVHRQILAGQAAPPPTAEAAAPRPAAPPETVLPRRPTSFVGRRETVESVAATVADGPLLTLTGVGGVGKTRLALEVADRVQPRFPDGVWLCELAAVQDPAAVGHAVAAALRVQQRSGLTIDDSIADYLRGREVLLVLDNCEHVLDAAAELVDALVRGCPKVTVLATSREPLGVAGERVLPVEPLPAADAAELFGDRAAARRPGFDVAADGADAVAQICDRLDGLPLAIELAAARMRVMSAAEALHRLEAGRFVGTPARGAPARHQSLSAAIDWSYRLMAEPERALFARLSVFTGGFDLNGAHGVCGDGDGSTVDDTLDLLTGLVDKSTVTVVDTGAGTRYRILETLRDHGRERLHDAGEDVVLARRHAAYFARLGAEVARGLHGPDERAWVERALPDHDNLRAAVDGAVADADADLALRLVTSVSELVHLRIGYEPADWALRALDLLDGPHPLAAAALGIAARGAWNRGDHAEARTLARRAGGQVPDRGTCRVAYPADVLVDVALSEGDAAPALHHYLAEVSRARREDDPLRLVWSLHYVAVCRAVLRAPEQGVAAATESGGGGGGRPPPPPQGRGGAAGGGGGGIKPTAPPPGRV